MSDKYQLEEVQDLSEWDRFIKSSPQETIFAYSDYLLAQGSPFSLFWVKKGNEIKAGFSLMTPCQGEARLDDLVIYNGIFFAEPPQQKSSKLRQERFRLLEFALNTLLERFQVLDVSFVPQLEDLRPVLWHNYYEGPRFGVDLRYTSYLDITELKGLVREGEDQTEIFKNMETLRQRNIREARKSNACVVCELNTPLFAQYYIDLMEAQGHKVSEEKVIRIKRLIQALVEQGHAEMYVAYNAGGTALYLTVFCFDQKRAYYLFGAGNLQAKERYQGTLCFWEAFIHLATEKNVYTVDLEGINSPQRGAFKLGFGGNIHPYFEVTWNPNSTSL